MKIKLLDEKCILTKGYISDAGWDLSARGCALIRPLETVKIPTGVCVEVPLGYAGDVRPRSSFSSKGILIHYGTVDVGYTGEISVTVTNLSGQDVEIKQHRRFAQLVITKISEDNSLEIVEELEKTSRGNNGFGSTGK